ncbi:MAG TPA: helix-turn-helix domain-containing protein [candidate division Zixibacteria bacterium]|nr:helix-turn-helix domain-containing protein [candidate division Zixibacteria bacterium]
MMKFTDEVATARQNEIELLRPDEVAKALRVEPRTVYRFIRTGVLPAVKIGRTVRIDAGELRRLLMGIPPAAAVDIEDAQLVSTSSASGDGRGRGRR